MPPFAALPRTAVHAWCPRGTLHPSPTGPLVVTGTVSGALDDSFSTDSQLELWQPFSSEPGALEQPIATVQLNARFNSLAWGKHAGTNSTSTPLGVIAAGLDDGGVQLWNPNALLNHRDRRADDEAAAALIARLDSPHRGPVRGLDFSPAQSNLLASGATNGEIYIWDLTSPLKPFSPGTRSRSLDSITSLAWNPSVVHILASSSNTGHTVVWDLKSKREITALSFASGGATGLGPTGFGGVGGQGGIGGLGPAGFGGGGGSAGGAGGAGVGGLGGHSAVKWHPENPTKLITASEDDHAPNLLVWDLRNWKQPEKVLRGHDKGILSVNFCPDDSDLVLSSGKDGRTLAWSLQSGEIVAEVTPSSNWTFESHFVPNNPSLISAAALDGELYLHSLQSTNSRQHEDDAAAAQQQQQDAASQAGTATGAGDFFEQAISANAKNYPTKSLAVAPKWLRRPSSAVFGFGGRLVRIGTSTAAAASNAAAAGSTVSTSRVTIDRVVTVPGVVDRAEKLERAATGQEEGGLAKFCDDRAAGTSDWDADDHDDDGSVLASTSEKESWALLKTLFHAAAGGMPGAGGPAAREKLVEMLGRGFDRDELKSRVDELAKQLRAKLPPLPAATVEDVDISPSPTPDSPSDDDKISRSQDAAATSEPSLFGGAAADDGMQAGGADGLMNGFGGGGDAAGGDDFFASLGQRPSALPDRLTQESRGGQPDASSSIAATIGSGPSSLKSVNVKQATFKLFHDEATEADKLVTQALVLGDFGSAVELALSTERYADALLFALQSGSPEVVASVQREYFARTATDRPYLRVLESVSATSVGGGGRDLADVIQNADLEQNWREAFVVACTYAATDDEFSSLIEQLGQRLEYQYELVRGRAGHVAAEQWRKNAVLCYLAAGKLEKVVGVWVQQMNEDEQARLGDSAAFARAASNTADEAASATARFEAHSRALQAFIEKVSVFQHAVGYVDVDLATPTQSTAVAESGARIYKLASLYDRYIEYAELLANQGKVDLALKYVAKTPADYDGTNAAVSRNAMKRERLLRASGAGQQFQQQGRQQQAMYGAAGGYGSTSAGRYAQNANPYGARASLPSVGAAAAPATNPYSNPLATPARTAYSNPYAPAPTQSPAASSNAYNPYAPAPSAASAAPATVASPMRSNPYAPAQPMTNPHDDPYAPAPSAQSSVPSAGSAVAAPPSAAANPYAPAPSASAGLSYASAPSASHDPYGPSTAASNPGAGLPGPPPIRTESPNFAARNASASANVPPPPRAKAAGGWNDVPTLPAPRRNTPAPTATAGSSPAPGAPKPAAITSPFPNSSPSGTPGPYGAPMMGAGQVPPPPPSRGANRTPAPVPPPPMTGQAAPPPMSGRVLSPPPVAGNPQYAPAPPRSLMGSLGPGQAPNGPPAGPSMMPPPPPPPQQQPAGQAFGMGAAPGQGAVVPPPPISAQRPGPTYAAPPPPRTGTPSAPPPPRANVAPPAPPTVNGGAMPAFGEARNGPAQPPQSQVQPPPHPVQQQQAPPPPPSGFARPPPPPNSSAPPQQQPGQVAPPPPRSAPSTPQAPQNSSFPGPPPMAAKPGPPPAPAQPPAPQPSQQAMPPQPPRMKYPPGDRSHIPPANKPIFDTLSAELQKLRQTTPPQQVKIVNDTEKRLNILFDMLNCETLSEASTQRMLELCQAVRARNQAQALDLHLQLITAGAPDVTPFQAAVKLLVQRMMIPAPPQH